jgi:hypothetical protein
VYWLEWINSSHIHVVGFADFISIMILVYSLSLNIVIIVVLTLCGR